MADKMILAKNKLDGKTYNMTLSSYNLLPDKSNWTYIGEFVAGAAPTATQDAGQTGAPPAASTATAARTTTVKKGGCGCNKRKP